MLRRRSFKPKLLLIGSLFLCLMACGAPASIQANGSRSQTRSLDKPLDAVNKAIPDIQTHVIPNPQKPGFAKIILKISLQAQEFSTQAVDNTKITRVQAAISGIGIDTPIYAAEADPNGWDNVSGGNATLSFSDVPYGKARKLYLLFSEADPGTTHRGLIGTAFDLSSATQNIELSYRTTPVYQIVNSLSGSIQDKELLQRISLSALQSFIDQVTGFSGTAPDYTYTQHPWLLTNPMISTIASHIRSNNGNIGALNPANPAYQGPFATVNATVSGLVGTDTVSLQINDASSPRLNAVGNGIHSLTPVQRSDFTGGIGEWQLAVKVNSSNGTQYTLNVSPSSPISGTGTINRLVSLTPVTPSLDSLSAASGNAGDVILINGSRFSTNASSNKVTFGSTVVPTQHITALSDSQLQVKVPMELGGTYPVSVSVGSQTSNSLSFTANALPFNLQNIPNQSRAEFFQSIQIVGNYAYLADQNPLLNPNSGMRILDLTHPVQPVEVGSYTTPGEAYTVKVNGTKAYIADGSAGLQILDISNPAQPSYLGSYNTPGTSYGLEIVGNTVYLADGSAGLQILDVSDPQAPVLLGAYDTPGQAYDVKVNAGKAYLADNSQLRILDISTPSAPALLGSVNASGRHIEIVDNLAYLSMGALTSVDISDPANPVVLDSLSGATNFTLNGNRAYAVLSNTLRVIDISDPANLVQLSQKNIAVAEDEASDIKIVGQRAYVAHDGGIEIFDLTTPNNPVSVFNYDLIDQHLGLKIKDQYAYVADDDNGLIIYDISDPSAPQMIRHLDLGLAVDVSIEGNYAFVYTEAPGRIKMVDISDPTNASLVYDFPSVTSPGARRRDVAIKDGRLYIANDTLGLQIYNISNPASPSLSKTYSGTFQQIEIVNNLAYVLSSTSSGLLEILDLTNPTNPVQLGSVAANVGNTVKLKVAGNYAYTSYVQIFDISQANSPSLTGSYNTSAQDMALAGSHLYLLNAAVNWKILNISNPAAPVLVTQQTSYRPQGIDISDGYAFIADFINGLVIVRLYD